MSKRFILRTDWIKHRAKAAIDAAPEDFECVIQKHDPKRSNDQNSLIQVLVRAIAQCYGASHDHMRWALCMDWGGSREVTTPKGEPCRVPVKTTSQMSKAESSDFVSYLQAFCASEGIEV